MVPTPRVGRRSATAVWHVAAPFLGAAVPGLPAGGPRRGSLPAEVAPGAAVGAREEVVAAREELVGAREEAVAAREEVVAAREEVVAAAWPGVARVVRRRAVSPAVRHRLTATRRETPTRAAMREARRGYRRSAVVSTPAGPARNSPAAPAVAGALARSSPAVAGALARNSPAVAAALARSSPAVAVAAAARRSRGVVEVETEATPRPERRAWDGWSDFPGCNPPRRDRMDPAPARISVGVAPASDFYRNRRPVRRCGYSP